MKLEVGSRYWFWNVQENRPCWITVTECTSTDFAFTLGRKKGRCSYKSIDGLLFKKKTDMPQFQQEEATNDNVDADEELGFDNLVGFEHSDLSGTGYKYYPSIYYYQGADDRLSHGSVFDCEEAMDYSDF